MKKFEDILSDIKNLIGLQLQAINKSTGILLLINIDLDKRKYYVKTPESSRIISRGLNELEKIWKPC